MTTATKPKRRKPANATAGDGKCPDCGQTKGARAQPAEARAAIAGQRRTVLLKQIDASPYQTRADFAEAEISKLAESIRTQGLVHAPIVRERVTGRSTRYELVAGERRLRACKQLGLKQIDVDVRQVDDRGAREIGLAENLQRESLNPIEEARAFRAMLAAGDAATQTELGDRLGVSQGHISSRLGLLDFPEAVQARIISREIPATHARVLVPLKDHPKLLTDIVKEVFAGGEPMSLEQFEEELHWALSGRTTRLAERGWSKKLQRPAPMPKLTEAQRQDLGIIHMPPFSGAKPRELATNVALWEKLCDEAEAAAVARAGKRKANKAAKIAQAKKEPEKLTPAERKNIEAQERARTAERTRQRRKQVWQWLIGFMLGWIAGAIRRTGDRATCERLLLYLATAPWAWEYGSDFSARLPIAEKLLRAINIPLRSRRIGFRNVPDLVGAFEAIPNEDMLHTFCVEFLARFFQTGPSHKIPDVDVRAIADMLGFDLAEAWKAAQKSDDGREYYNLHSKDELAELAKELKVPLDGAAKKDEIVARFLAAKRTLPLPKEFKRLKRPR